MADNELTVGEMDEQVTADDMRHLMAEAPGAAVPVVRQDIQETPVSSTPEQAIPAAPVTNEAIRAAVVAKPAEETRQEHARDTSTSDTSQAKRPVIGASMPSDSDVSLPDSASGKEKIEAAKKASAAKPAEPKKPNLFLYQDPILGMLTNRNPDGTFKTGQAQNTNKNGTAGRPKIIDQEILLKLEVAFCMGCTDEEACQFAGIGKSTLYLYQNEHPEFLEEKELWKENPTLKARAAVYMAMGTDSDLALKYLERKKKDEFSLRTEHTGKNGDPIETVLNRVESNYDDLARQAAADLAAKETTGTAPGETAE